MRWTPQLRDFIQRHLNDDTSSLLLAAKKYPAIDVPSAVQQIEARQRLKTKLPQWHANPNLIMSGRVPAEQCSSEQTARYKRSIIDGQSLCDMTGGMGVDCWYMSEGMKQAIYTERDETLCHIARHNFQALQDEQHPPIEVRHGDAQTLPLPSVDVIYLDPARRAADGSRVYAIEDSQPNIIQWQDQLLRHAKTLLVKLSPMIDLTDTLRKLHSVTQVHILALRGECKEILVKMENTPSASQPVEVHCVDYLPSGTVDYTFTPSEEEAPIPTTDRVGQYLYEPDVTLMKAQAFSSLTHRYPLRQLHRDTHLMTSDHCIPAFPGRIFVVEAHIPFASKTLKRLKSHIPQANIATRNFPLTADQLRQRTGIRDGGEVYLFGVKVQGQGHQLLQCRKP